MRERALEVQAGLTSVANEVVVLVMVGGAGSTTARGLRRPTGSSSWPGTTSMGPRQPCLGWSDIRLHASNCVLVTVVTQGAVGLENVTEPPKIILYYRLSLSTWSLSNNKELFCHFCQVKPGKSLTTGSRYALIPQEGRTRVQHYIT
jgi:hypothetical protein